MVCETLTSSGIVLHEALSVAAASLSRICHQPASNDKKHFLVPSTRDVDRKQECRSAGLCTEMIFFSLQWMSSTPQICWWAYLGELLKTWSEIVDYDKSVVSKKVSHDITFDFPEKNRNGGKHGEAMLTVNVQFDLIFDFKHVITLLSRR